MKIGEFNKKDLLILLSSVFGHLIFLLFVRINLSPIHFPEKNLLLLDLIGIPFSFSFVTLTIFSVFNLTLCFFIGKKIFKGTSRYLPCILYALTPWLVYLVAAESFYITILMFLLIGIFALFLRDKGRVIFVSVSILSCLYSSVLMWPTLFLGLFLLVLLKISFWRELRNYLILIAIGLIPMIFLVATNLAGFKNILNNEVRIFEDPGLLNSVNAFYGNAAKKDAGGLAKISENKYLYFSEYGMFKFLKQLTPTTYFTPQEKLLGFSFTPPILVGLLIPFLLGLFSIRKFGTLSIKFGLTSLVLIIPSFLSKTVVDLNRLVIFFPVIIFLITVGYEELEKVKRSGWGRYLFILMSTLIIFQFSNTLFDISAREKERFHLYMGENFVLEKQ